MQKATCFFITLYFVTFFKLISNKFKLKKHTAFFVLALFILMHFWIFRCQEEKNTFMFATVDVCCLYYYIVSNMVNATIVMKLINNDFLYGSIKEKNSVKTGLVLVAVYFALFSNLYASIILAVYIGTQLLVEFFNVLKNKNFLETLKNNIIRLIYIFSWAAMQLFEMNGTRAKSLEKGSSILELIKENLKEFWKIKNKVNGNFKKYVLVIFVFFILCIIVTYITKKELKKENVKFLKEIFFLVFPLVISATYLIIVSAKHYIGSIARPDINFGIVFYGFIILFYMICYLVNKIQFTNIILPIFLIAILFDIDTTERTFSVYYYNGPTDQKRIEISDDIVDQIIEADKNGTEMTLYVPKFNDGDNWPIATYAGNDISRTLYKYGIINYYINVNMVPTEDKNVELGLY